MTPSQRTILLKKPYLATNMLTNAAMSGTTGWTPYSCTHAAANGIITLTGDGSTSLPNVYQNITAVTGKIYYYAAWAMIEDATNIVSLHLRSESAALAASSHVPVAGTWYRLSALTTSGVTGSKSFAIAQQYTSKDNANGHVMKCTQPMCICLTDLFGAIAPNLTKSQCDRIFARWFASTGKVFK